MTCSQLPQLWCLHLLIKVRQRHVHLAALQPPLFREAKLHNPMGNRVGLYNSDDSWNWKCPNLI
jgi:hypothetical protein